MARVICQALIDDKNEMERVQTELKELNVKFAIYRNYVHADYSSKSLGKIRQVKNVFYGLKYYNIQEIG